MSTHKGIRHLRQPDLQSGLAIHLFDLNFQATKLDLEQVLKGLGFDQCIFYWPYVPPSDTKEHKGWCRVQFVDKDTTERAKRTLLDASLKGRRVKIGSIPSSVVSLPKPMEVVHLTDAMKAASRAPTRQPVPSVSLESIITPASAITISSAQHVSPLPPSHSARAIQLPAPTPTATPAPATFSEAAKVLKAAALAKIPQNWSYDDENPDLAHSLFMSRMKRLEIAYENAGVVSRPLTTKNEEGKEILRSQEFPSPAGRNHAHGTRTWVHIKKGHGKSIQFKRIDLEHLADYEADD